MPAKIKGVSITPPDHGIVRSVSLQSQPPLSAVSSVNFVPFDHLDGRRGVSATRPPLQALTPPGSAVNLLAQLNLPSPTLYASSNGAFYKYTGGAWVLVSASVGIVATRPVYTAPFHKKLVILNDTAALVYDSTANTLTALTATTGTIPANCRVGCTSQGCLFIGGDPDNPNVFSHCRVGDITDWNFAASDTAGAFQATGDEFGLIQEPLTAIIPYSKNQTLIACEQSLWALNGLPRSGGTLQLLSPTVGVLGQNAWCVAPDGRMYFLSNNGLMTIPPNSALTSQTPTEISKEVIPEQLFDITLNTLNPTSCVGYDRRWGGVVITDRTDDAEQAWWYDVYTGGFFQLKFAAYPTVLFHFDPYVTEDASGLLFGGVGYGGLSRLDRTGSEALAEAKQIIGPIRLSPSPRYKTQIQRADLVLGAATNDSTATFDFHTAPSGQIAVYRAETASDLFNYQVDVDTLLENRKACLPQVAGHAVTLTITQTPATTNRVVFEGCFCETVDAGYAVDSGLVAPVIDTPDVTLTFGTN